MVSNRELSGGEALVEGLAAHGVDTVFGIPGVQTYALFDALGRRDGEITVIAPRHEQATAYMAFGYAKAGGRPGVFAVVPGVGFLNTSAAVASAYGASTPVLGLTGEVPSEFIASGMGHLHELPDQLAMMRGVTKWAERNRQPGRRRAPRRGGLLPDVDRPAAPGGAGHAPGTSSTGAWRWVRRPSRRLPQTPPVDLDAVDRAAAILPRGAGADDHGGQRDHGRRR